MKRVFISYSRKDAEFVECLLADLEPRIPDVEFFYDTLIPPGDSWAIALSGEIERADVILAVVSPSYLESAWAKQEMMLALDLQAKVPETRVIPLVVRPCDMSGFLFLNTWIDFTGNYESAIVNLIWGITGEKPAATKGIEPGVPSESTNVNELERLRQEVREAVKLFKSKVVDHQDAQKRPSLAGVKKDGKQRCFVVMPFGDPELQVVYEDFVKPTIESESEWLCERGDDVFGSNVIMDDIVHSIEMADIVVADLTQKNANVFYEVGICHALRKPVLLLAQAIDDVPFDLRHRRVFLYEYSPRGCKRLESTLKENLLATLGDKSERQL